MFCSAVWVPDWSPREAKKTFGVSVQPEHPDLREGRLWGEVGDACGIRGRPDDLEVIIRKTPLVDTQALVDECLLLGWRMHEEEVAVSPCRDLDRDTGPLGGDLEVYTGLVLVDVLYRVEELRIIEARRGGDEEGIRPVDHGSRCCCGRGGDCGGVTGVVWGWEVHPAMRIPIRRAITSRYTRQCFLVNFMRQINTYEVI